MSVSTVSGRILLTTVAILFAALLLRGQLSSALVTRGDALAYWGAHNDARVMYARALAFDETNRIAADRYAFAAAISNNSDAIRGGIEVASRYLTRFPDDGVVLMDRALCYQHQGKLAAAIADFQRSGRIERDPRAFMFAALDERALHHASRARAFFRTAIVVDPQFTPARFRAART